MNFSWSEGQTQDKEEIIRFAQEELNDGLIELDSQASFNRKGWEKCGQFGVLGLPITTEYGGSGASVLTTLYMLEGLGYGCKDAGLIFSMNAHMWGCEIPIQTFGTESQKKRYLPKLCDGRWIGALAVAEKEAGSDLDNIQTRAQRNQDVYLLNGSKVFVTNGPIADVVVVLAKLTDCSAGEGMTAFLVEKNTPGFSVSRTIDKMGLRTSSMGELGLENCRVPAENCLGQEGVGFSVFQQAMEWERTCILAAAVGAMERQLENCIQQVRTRRQFGQAIGKFQLVGSKIVDLKMRLETSRLVLYKTGWLKDTGERIFMEASLAKLYISECWVRSCLDALQIHGGYGYLTEKEVERELRDALGSKLYSGTSEIQRVIVAKLLGL